MKKLIVPMLGVLCIIKSSIAQEINKIEYFFDKDSGVGKGKNLPVISSANTVKIMNAAVLIGQLANGMHTMHIRAGNDSGWSQYVSQMFYVRNDLKNMSSIISGEYFLDQDPGVGSAQTIKFDFSPTGNIVNQTFNLSLPPGTDSGKHFMYVRVKDADGHWSLFQDSLNVFTLPLTGLSLSAARYNKKVILNWYTLTESNTDHFQAEKSVNGISFSGFGKVIAKGNSSNKSNYTFTDANPATGLNYYRIKEVDNDGRFVYSLIVKLWFDEEHRTLSVYPNPANETVNIKYKSGRTSVVINLYDAAGKWVKLYKLPFSNNLQLNVSELASGTYTIHISDGIESQTGKFVKK